MKCPAIATWAATFLVVSLPAVLHAAPRKTGKSAEASAKSVDVLKAADDKLIELKLLANTATTATLTLSNVSQDPLNVKVPLAMAAIPEAAPPGAGQQYYAAVFGIPSAPPSLAIAVSPLGAAGIDKKSRKTNVKAIKKPKAGDDEKGDDKDGKKDDDKKSEAMEASVFLLPGAQQTLSLSSLMVDTKKLPASYGPFTLAELDKISQAPELKKLLEMTSQGTIPHNVAQELAWKYHSQRNWEEMVKDGLITLVDVEVAKQYADVIEGKAPAEAAPTTGKKKKRSL
jgi:hypothetical protein